MANGLAPFTVYTAAYVAASKVRLGIPLPASPDLLIYEDVYFSRSKGCGSQA